MSGALGALAGLAGAGGRRTGYFRGAAFRVDGYEHATGRRNELHEYPLRNEPLPEDLGRKARRIVFTAYVIGASWEFQRDALLNACEADGSGLLLHPYLGQFQCLCDTVRVSESRADGQRIARFDLEFLEDGGFEYPTGTPNANRGVFSALDAAFPAVTSAFAGNFQVNGLSNFVANDATALVTNLVEDVTLYLDRVVPDPAAMAVLEEAIGDWFPNTDDFVRQDPALVAAGLSGFMHDVGSKVITEPEPALVAMAEFSAWQHRQPPIYHSRTASDSTPIYTPTRRQQQRNRDAITGIVQRSSVLTAAERLPDLTLESPRVAIGIRDSFTAASGPVVEQASLLNDGTARPLKRTEAAAVALLTARIGPLADVELALYPLSLPLNAAAHALYRDARRARVLLAANLVPHPSFMPRALVVPT